MYEVERGSLVVAVDHFVSGLGSKSQMARIDVKEDERKRLAVV